MDTSIPVLESPAMPTIRKIKNMLCYETEELMDQVEEFKTFVDELKDYSWRLTEKETAFLELALELQKRLVKDAAFIETAENIADCHSEMEEAMKKQIVVTKERIQVQEEILSLSMSAEDAIDNRIEILEKELRPLMKRKRNLQMDIQYDIAKLIKTRSFLARLQEKQERLEDDLDKVIFDSNVAKRYKGEIEELHARAVEAAYVVA
jgi:DNA repair exonuclease SbcCD ATPase subunit